MSSHLALRASVSTRASALPPRRRPRFLPGGGLPVEMMELRLLLSGFPNWAQIQPAIGLVPQSAGHLANTSVVNFGTTVYTGPLDVTNTLNRIRADNGPDRGNDGSVYTNPQGSGLPVDGTYYEFTVEPTGGTDRNFSSISFPGPMRVLLATGGDCFFTGDHYSTFQSVYIAGAGTGTPTIGSFTDNPTTVTVGASTTLTAFNVAETGGSGSITGINFYRESNGSSGLQVGSDTLVGAGTQSGTSWTTSASTTGLTAGNYTYYAVATDSNSATSPVASTTLTVTSGGGGGGGGGTSITGLVEAWDVNGQSNFGKQALGATTVATGAINSLGLTRGSGVATNESATGNAWGGSNWASTSSAGLSGNSYASFGFTVGSGYTTSLASIALNYSHSGNGPVSGYWQYQVNGGSWGLIGDFANEFSSSSSSGAAITPIALTGVSTLQHIASGTAVNFRVVPYGASSTGGTWYIHDGGNNTNDLLVNATSTPNLRFAATSRPSGLADPIVANYLGSADESAPTPPTPRKKTGQPTMVGVGR